MKPIRRHVEWLPLAAIASPFVLGWLLVSPWQNVPVIDDWVYAWSVEHLLKTRQLAVADISAVYPITQIAWGSIVSTMAGFSFGALRLSTVVLAFAGCWSLYLTLRELGVRGADSLLAALAMALHPVYFAIAFSFMTDVPFVSLTSVTLYCYVSAVQRDRPARLWAGTLFAVLAFLVRSVGIVLPIALLAAIARRIPTPSRSDPPTRVDSKHILAHTTAGLLVMVAIWFALPRVVGPLSGQSVRLEGLRWWFLVTPREYATWNAGLVLIAAFPFAPLLLATLTDRWTIVRVTAVSAAIAVLCLATLHTIPSPLPDWQTWSLQDIGARAMIGGTVPPSMWSVRAAPFVKAAGIIVFSALIVAMTDAVRRGRSRPGRMLLVVGVLNFALINVLWFYNDRYYLVFIPTLAYIATVKPFNASGRWIAGVLLAVWAFVSITGARDMLATNAACARIANELEAQGVPPSEIDAGYSLNGWRLYVHPENLPPTADRRSDVPFVTSNRETLYRIVSSPEPEYDVVKVEGLPAAWWQVTDRLYVVRKRP